MSTDDASYYRQRAIDERAMAQKADRKDVSLIHEELARQYQALVDSEELRSGLRSETSTRVWA
jgi:hypothetical protein